MIEIMFATGLKMAPISTYNVESTAPAAAAPPSGISPSLVDLLIC